MSSGIWTAKGASTMKLSRRAVVMMGLGSVPGLVGTGSLPLKAANPSSETIVVNTPSGRRIEAVLAIPGAVPAPSVMIIHGSFGASDWYRSLASKVAEDGFVGLSVDLYGGEVTTDLGQAALLRGKALADFKGTTEIIRTWLDWLRRDPRTNRKVGLIGFSLGAFVAIEFAMTAPVEATVFYYGLPAAREVDGFQGAALGHFGKDDRQIGVGSVERFESRMLEKGKAVEIHWYEAGHSFANPELPEYDAKAADVAWRRTLDFLRVRLG
jgi:carboxymethylenebutenolidase